MLQQIEVDVGLLRVTILYHPTDFLGLPIYDACHNERETITRIELSLQITSWNFALFSIQYLASQRVDLFALQ